MAGGAFGSSRVSAADAKVAVGDGGAGGAAFAGRRAPRIQDMGPTCCAMGREVPSEVRGAGAAQVPRCRMRALRSLRVQTVADAHCQTDRPNAGAGDDDRHIPRARGTREV